jgi:hypothetical protein
MRPFPEVLAAQVLQAQLLALLPPMQVVVALLAIVFGLMVALVAAEQAVHLVQYLPQQVQLTQVAVAEERITQMPQVLAVQES